MSEEQSELEAAKPNRLKSVDAQTLEETIAKAIGDLLGAEYKCEVNNISYSQENFLGSDAAKFEVNLWKNVWRKD